MLTAADVWPVLEFLAEGWLYADHGPFSTGVRKLYMVQEPSLFSKFPNLPREVRDRIWDSFLHDEPAGRLVIYDSWDGTVIPTLSLLPSPLFQVSTESRARAKAFYHVELKVFSRYTIDHWRYLQSQKDTSLFDTLEESWCEGANCAGSIYLNLSRDLIFEGYGLYGPNIQDTMIVMHQCLANAHDLMGYRHRHLPSILMRREHYRAALRFTTSQLPLALYRHRIVASWRNRCLTHIYLPWYKEPPRIFMYPLLGIVFMLRGKLPDNAFQAEPSDYRRRSRLLGCQPVPSLHTYCVWLGVNMDTEVASEH